MNDFAAVGRPSSPTSTSAPSPDPRCLSVRSSQRADTYITRFDVFESVNERPDIVLFGLAFAFGALAPAGSLYGMAALPALEPAGDLLLVAWFALLALGTALLGARLPTDALLGGTLLGALAGFWTFEAVVGWSYVMFAIVPIALLAFVVGAWVAYERNRRSGEVEEPSHGTWRYVFVALALAPIAFSLLLLFA